MKLTATNVNETFLNCLFKEAERKDNPVIVQGVHLAVGFNPQRLEENKSNIAAMLSELPIEFQQSGGGGMSFLNACNDKEGNQWSDLHRTMDQLLCLGLASGKVSYPLPREMWDVLPGGVPYFVVIDKQPEVVE